MLFDISPPLHALLTICSVLLLGFLANAGLSTVSFALFPSSITFCELTTGHRSRSRVTTHHGVYRTGSLQNAESTPCFLFRRLLRFANASVDSEFGVLRPGCRDETGLNVCFKT